MASFALLLGVVPAAPSREFHGSRFDETLEAEGRTLALFGELGLIVVRFNLALPPPKP